MRAAIYCRVSTQEQKRGFSLAGQLNECRTYCDRHQYRVVRILRDVASGRTMERPGFQRLVQAGLRGDFEVIVVWHRSRFGRDPDHKSVIGRLLRDAGVRIVAIHDGPRSDTAQERCVDRILDALDELELDNIVDRFKLGRHQAAREGTWPTRPPYGYRRAREPSKSLLLHHAEADALRTMYHLVASGSTVRDVAALLDCAHATVLARTRNPAYRGDAVYAGIRVPVPAIVTPDEWLTANAALTQRAKRPRFTRVG